MIFDSIDNAEIYYGLGSKFEKAFRFLKDTDLESLEPGRIDIDGDNIFAVVHKYETKNEEETKWESHQKYIDIQYMVSGSENFGVVNVDYLDPIDNYDIENDITFYKGEGDFIQLNDEEFVIVFPQDAHMPCVAVEEKEEVKKVVIKLKV